MTWLSDSSAGPAPDPGRPGGCAGRSGGPGTEAEPQSVTEGRPGGRTGLSEPQFRWHCHESEPTTTRVIRLGLGVPAGRAGPTRRPLGAPAKGLPVPVPQPPAGASGEALKRRA